jgi:hypothetical protein
MRRFLLIISIIITVSQGTAQIIQDPSLINVSLGYGPNYGGVGVKTVIGYGNSGLLIGVGYTGIGLAYAIGGQYGIGPWYINGGYAPYGGGYDRITSNARSLYGANIMSGVNLRFGKSRKLFFDLGIGYSWGGTIPELDFRPKTYMWGFGFGYRFSLKNNWS